MYVDTIKKSRKCRHGKIYSHTYLNRIERGSSNDIIEARQEETDVCLILLGSHR